MDVARPLDRARSARRGRAPRRDRAGRVDALDRPRRDLAGPPARRPPRRPFPRLASAGPGSRVRGGRRGRRVERRRGRHLEDGRRGAGAPLHVVRDRRPRGPGPLVRVGEHGAVRRARRLAIRRRPSTDVGTEVGSGSPDFPTRCRRCRTRWSPPKTGSLPASRAASCGRAGTAATPGRRCTLLGSGLTRLLALVSAPR